ncbi:dATP/dGTP pyrophosphohydrolase domain-containing protein [Litorimonas sp. RW-G-Af-16]|uniref:dATP/dGTP pyrophosphohydrolase domain-containing protein n=1 Tax=Litorimonas sp. RW-G-Af-16 TaxID=3241168 RepID=UPI00390CA6E3
MPRESSVSILKWGDDTFGPVSDPTALVRRAQLEMDELLEALDANDNDEAGREAADVTILLHRLMGLLGKDLAKEVDTKMMINRTRRWTSSGDGTGGHIKKDT